MTGHCVTMVPRSASRRAGLPVVGAHQLRHTVATQMLRARELRCLRSPRFSDRMIPEDTTAIYAKVNRAALGLVVRPWPGAPAVTALDRVAEDYQQCRRWFRHQLRQEEQLLRSFTTYLQARGLDRVTVTAALGRASRGMRALPGMPSGCRPSAASPPTSPRSTRHQRFSRVGCCQAAPHALRRICTPRSRSGR